MLPLVGIILGYTLLFCSAYATTSIPESERVTSVSIAEFAPYTQFARAAYCPHSRLNGWRCGAACKALPTFQLSLLAGDGNGVQTYFVGYWPPQRTVIVAHQGTDPIRLISDLTDINILLDPLDKALFPGIPPGIKVHDGFRNEHALTAPVILSEVRRIFKLKKTKKVTVVGHSLGGALAELDALYLTLNLPANTSVKAVTYGTPRVGNLAFAQFIDKKVPQFRRINNKRDIVAIVPGRKLGFVHPQGEIHILDSGQAVSCPGNDDATDSQCQIRTVPTVLQGSISDHLGPYGGIGIGTLSCT